MSLVENLKNNQLAIFANGYSGVINANGLNFVSNLQPDGTLSFESHIHFYNEPDDAIVGTLKGRNIAFTRTRPGSFVQNYNGWFFEIVRPNTVGEVAGFFDHNGVKQYGWYGWLQAFSPR